MDDVARRVAVVARPPKGTEKARELISKANRTVSLNMVKRSLKLFSIVLCVREMQIQTLQEEGEEARDGLVVDLHLLEEVPH